jgi:hypothetical protein
MLNDVDAKTDRETAAYSTETARILTDWKGPGDPFTPKATGRLVRLERAKEGLDEVVQMQIKVNCPDEDSKYALALENQHIIHDKIRSLLLRELSYPVTLKKAIISRGSINFDFSFDAGGGFYNLIALIRDLVNVVPEIIDACCDFVTHLTTGKPLNKETAAIATAATAGAAGAVTLALLGGPVGWVALAGFGGYQLVKWLMK